MDLQTLIEWEEEPVPKPSGKQWVAGWLFLICMACAVVLYLYRGSLPLPFPLAPICFLCLGLAFYGLGVIRYRTMASRLSDEAKRCRHCGETMAEYVTDMRRCQLPRADFSRRALLHRSIVKEKLFEGTDGHVYMVGKKSHSPGMGYAGWKRMAFLLKTKWLACLGCRCSVIQDSVFESVATTDSEIEDLVRDTAEIG